LNPANGSIKWVEPTRDMVKSSPAIASDGTIYIGSNDKSIYAFNPDGTEKSRFEAGGSVNSGPSIWSDGTIYFTSSDGKLTALSGTRGIGLADSPWPKFRHDLINNGRR
jgi:outer membrane protein assembly factor BamB